MKETMKSKEIFKHKMNMLFGNNEEDINSHVIWRKLTIRNRKFTNDEPHDVVTLKIYRNGLIATSDTSFPKRLDGAEDKNIPVVQVDNIPPALFVDPDGSRVFLEYNYKKNIKHMIDIQITKDNKLRVESTTRNVVLDDGTVVERLITLEPDEVEITDAEYSVFIVTSPVLDYSIPNIRVSETFSEKNKAHNTELNREIDITLPNILKDYGKELSEVLFDNLWDCDPVQMRCNYVYHSKNQMIDMIQHQSVTIHQVMKQSKSTDSFTK